MGSSAAVRQERRCFPRIRVAFPVEVRLANYKQVFTAANISDGGLFVTTGARPRLPAGTIICLTEEGKDTVLGQVVWVSDSGMGIKYLDKPVRINR